MPKALGTSGAVIYFPEGLITFFASPLGVIDTVKKNIVNVSYISILS